MPKTIKYVGTQKRWSELAVTGRQSVWMPGSQDTRELAEADLLLGTGLFFDVGAAVITGDEIHLDALTRVGASGVAVADLPAAAAGNTGFRGFVTDSNAALTAGIGAVVAGGGANVVPVFSDGAAWRIG